MRTIFVGFALGGIAVASPAVAQDSGTAGGQFVAGAILGIDQVETEFDGLSSRDEDIMVGLTAGYDYETASGLVIGVEAEYTDSSLGVTQTDVDVAGDRLSINAGRDLYVGGRLGFRPGRNGILYVKAGYTNASIEGEYDDGTGAVSDDVTFDGFRLGAGGEIDLSSKFGIRLEYRYSDYGSLDPFGFDTGINVSRNQGVVTLLGKF